MADQLQLEVVTPERRVLAEAVNSVTVPGRAGEMQILPGHAALIAELQTGVLAYNQGGTTHRLHVSGGFIEVNSDRVSVLPEVAERPEEIDVDRAGRGKSKAQELLAKGADIDFEKVRAKLLRNITRLDLAKSIPEQHQQMQG